jgi:hypothetical protein
MLTTEVLIAEDNEENTAAAIANHGSGY